MANDYDVLSTVFGPDFGKIRARERFFIERERPSGMVSDTVIQSWERCLSKGRSIQEAVQPRILPQNELKNSLRRSHRIVGAAEPELQKLDATLAQTGCSAVLLDPAGVVVRASPEQMASGHLARRLARPGVDMSEDAIGTSAPGIVINSGKAARVDCAEHYFTGHALMRCAAAPILDWHGGLAGVLNLSIESGPFKFDPSAIVETYATLIESRLLRVQPVEYRLIEFHVVANMLGSGLAGLAGVRPDGRVVWVNRIGARLLGVSHTPNSDIETLFGLTISALRVLGNAPQGRAITHCLPSGMTIALSVPGTDYPHDNGPCGCGRECSAQIEPSPILPPARVAVLRDDRLGDQQARLIGETLSAMNGNISRAARRLGISRGRIYRAMKGRAEIA
jgi:transcriptional regulator of acetoin/glycerol metabolism